MRFGAGVARVDPDDGAVVAVEHPERPGMTYLLDETTEPWHTAERRWGKGFVITDRGAARWDAAARPEIVTGPDGARVTATHALGDGLILDVERRLGTTWVERYALRCTGARRVAIRTLGIYTPWRDVYQSAADALGRAVHAHVWPGGGDAFALAQPMDGGGPVLGLRVRAGELWAYSIESREALVTGSNVRGHVVMHVTDAARARHAFGGQPEISVPPGAAYVLEWELDWYESMAAFRRRHPPSVELDAPVAGVGEPIPFRRRGAGVRVQARAPVSVAGDALSCSREGEAYVDVEADGRRSRVAVAWHAPLEEVVRRRVRFVLAHQRAGHRAGAAAAAFLPFDTEHGVPVLAGGWADFSDGRERIGMGLLLQEALARGWVDDPAEASEAAAAYRRFVVEFLVTGDDGLRADSHHPAASERLYDLPWAVLLLAAHDTDRALRLFRAYYARGGADFLAIGIGVAARALVRALHASGREDDAGDVLGLVRRTPRGASRRVRTCPPTRSITSSRWSPRCSRSSASRRPRPTTQPRRGCSTPRSPSACRGCWPSAGRSPTCACATSRSVTGTATGSGASSCGVTPSRTTGACSRPTSSCCSRRAPRRPSSAIAGCRRGASRPGSTRPT